MAVSFMDGLRLPPSRKLTQPIVRTIPQAQVSGLPLGRGEGRFRARTPASLRHRASYSASRCFRQNASVRPTTVSYAGLTVAGTVGSSPCCRLVRAIGIAFHVPRVCCSALVEVEY